MSDEIECVVCEINNTGNKYIKSDYQLMSLFYKLHGATFYKFLLVFYGLFNGFY